MESHLTDSSLEEGGNRRNGTFEPKLVKKCQTILTDELDNKILALYGLGTSYSDISSHLLDIYGAEVSPATISAVTDNCSHKLLNGVVIR